MQWKVDDTEPRLFTQKYELTFDPSNHEHAGRPVLRRRADNQVLVKDLDEVANMDGLLSLFITAFEWDCNSRFTFLRGRAASQHWMQRLSNLARKYRGGYRMTFESMTRWS